MPSQPQLIVHSGIFLDDLSWHGGYFLTEEEESDDLACLTSNASLSGIPRSVLYQAVVLGVTPTVACASIAAELLLCGLLLRLLAGTRLLFYLLLAVKACADLLMLTLWLVSDLLDSCPYVCPFSSARQLFRYKSLFYAKVYYPLANACSAASIYMMVGVTLLWAIVVTRSCQRCRCSVVCDRRSGAAVAAAWLLAIGVNLPRAFCLTYRCHGDQLVPCAGADWCQSVHRWLSLSLMQIGPMMALICLSCYLLRRMLALARGCASGSRHSNRRTRCILLMNACFLAGQLPAFIVHPDSTQGDLLDRGLSASARVVITSLINCLEAASYAANLVVLAKCDSRFRAQAGGCLRRCCSSCFGTAAAAAAAADAASGALHRQRCSSDLVYLQKISQ